MNEDNKKSNKKKYVSPQLKKERLLSFGAKCNGMGGGGRKSSTSGPIDFCSANKLLS